MLAQGKAADLWRRSAAKVQAAALGKEPLHPTSFFSSGWARQKRAQPEEKKEGIILRP